jgi:hypothetical protein
MKSDGAGGGLILSMVGTGRIDKEGEREFKGVKESLEGAAG